MRQLWNSYNSELDAVFLMIGGAAVLAIAALVMIPTVRQLLVEPEPESRPNRLDWRFWLPLMIGAAAIRTPAMFDSLWYDETFTSWLVMLDFRSMLAATAGDVHPPLWYIIEWITVHILDKSDFALRIPAFLLGMLAVWLTWVVLDAVGVPTPVAALATWLTALSPFLVYYSAEARMYSLLLVVVLWSVYTAVKGPWWMMIPAITAGLYTHNMFILYLPMLLVLAYTRRGELAIYAAGLAGAIYAPWAVIAISQVMAVQADYWILPINAGRVANLLYVILAGPGHHEFMVLLSAMAMLAIVVLGSVLGWRNKIWLFNLAWGPVVTGLILSVAVKPVLISRILIGCVPFLLALVAWLQWRVIRRWGAWTVLPLGALMVALLITQVQLPIRADLRAKYNQIAVAPGDSCYHLNASSLIVAAYVLPQCTHYLWPAEQSLEQTISQATKKAMGMRQAFIEDVPADKIWLFHYTGPHVTGPEYDEATRILSAYPVESVQRLDNNEIASTSVWRLCLGGNCEVAGYGTHRIVHR